MVNQIRKRRRRFASSLHAFWHNFKHPPLQEHIDVNYMTKWLLLGAIIGIGTGLAAMGFHKTIELVTGWTLGSIAGFTLPQPSGDSCGDYHDWNKQHDYFCSID